MGPVRLIGMDRTTHGRQLKLDRDFNFTAKYAADERWVANPPLPGVPPLPYPPDTYPAVLATQIEGGL